MLTSDFKEIRCTTNDSLYLFSSFLFHLKNSDFYFIGDENYLCRNKEIIFDKSYKEIIIQMKKRNNFFLFLLENIIFMLLQFTLNR